MRKQADAAASTSLSLFNDKKSTADLKILLHCMRGRAKSILGASISSSYIGKNCLETT